MLCYRLCLGVAAVIAAARLSLPAQIVINEIHFDPDVKTELVEFIELHNAGTSTVNLSGWQFTDGVTYTFPNGTSLAAGGYLVIAQNPAAVQAKFGATALGPWTGTLANEGEKIVLQNAAGGAEDEVDYQLGFPWPTVGDAAGLFHRTYQPGLRQQSRRELAPVCECQRRAARDADRLEFHLALFQGHERGVHAHDGLARARVSTMQAGSPARAPIGYGETFISTPLNDMRNNYTTVFPRKKFVVAECRRRHRVSRWPRNTTTASKSGSMARTC